jgi:hypothetical protein
MMLSDHVPTGDFGLETFQLIALQRRNSSLAGHAGFVCQWHRYTLLSRLL